MHNLLILFIIFYNNPPMNLCTACICGTVEVHRLETDHTEFYNKMTN